MKYKKWTHLSVYDSNMITNYKHLEKQILLIQQKERKINIKPKK